jgi:hypothetical protein
MHILMEITQGNSLCSYLYLKQAKMSFFFLFSSTKSENKKVNRSCGAGGRMVPVGGRVGGERG